MTLSPCNMPTRSAYEVAIIGGGLAGLYAAHLLQKAAIDFVLIEARERLGGRILTVDADGLPANAGFDLGPSWYWPSMQPAIGALVEELGLSSFQQHAEGDILFEREHHEAPQRYRGFAQDQHSMRLAGGSVGLVRALSASLPPANILLRSPVRSMALAGEGVDLIVLNPVEAPRRIAASHVISTVPPRLLDSTVVFTPAQEATTRQLWQATPTWMAPHAKFFALYPRSFWRDAGFSGTAQSMIGPMAEIHDATTSLGQAALFGFIALSADHRAAMGKESLIHACVDQLGRLFGAEARQPIATLFKDWSTDPLTATELDRAASEHPKPGNHLWVSGPWRQRLALGGSETSPTEPGYLVGAILAANRAANETLRKLETSHSQTERKPKEITDNGKLR